jgi:hypothetical protein
MNNKYYYLVSSLPYLRFGQEPPISKEDFTAECAKWLSSQDAKAVVSADIDIPKIKSGDPDLLKEWKNFDLELKEALAKARKAKRAGEGYKAEGELKNITERENPLLMEKSFERMRWTFLEEKELGYNFDVNRLIIYFLKLQILERLAMFDKDKGETFFHELCEVRYE